MTLNCTGLKVGVIATPYMIGYKQVLLTLREKEGGGVDRHYVLNLEKFRRLEIFISLTPKIVL